MWIEATEGLMGPGIAELVAQGRALLPVSLVGGDVGDGLAAILCGLDLGPKAMSRCMTAAASRALPIAGRLPLGATTAAEFPSVATELIGAVAAYASVAATAGCDSANTDAAGVVRRALGWAENTFGECVARPEVVVAALGGWNFVSGCLVDPVRFAKKVNLVVAFPGAPQRPSMRVPGDVSGIPASICEALRALEVGDAAALGAVLSREHHRRTRRWGASEEVTRLVALAMVDGATGATVAAGGEMVVAVTEGDLDAGRVAVSWRRAGADADVVVPRASCAGGL